MKGNRTTNKRKSNRISRRNFLKRVAIGGSFSAGFLGSLKNAFAENFSGWPDRYGMLVDLTRCIGCRRCEAACNKINQLPAPKTPFEDKSVFEKKRRTDARTYTVVNRYADSQRLGEPVYRKVQCMHCNEPACVSACLVGAMKKTPEGPVIWDKDLCIGCRYCMNACPFYIPKFEYDNAFAPRIQKCFMCYGQRIKKGLVPACAAACPMEALTFGKRRDMLELARERIENAPGKYIDHVYGENEAGGTSWLYISPMSFEQVDLPTNLGTTPFPMYTRDFLSMVPFVLTVWPAFLGAFYLFSKRREKLAQSETPKQGEEEKS